MMTLIAVLFLLLELPLDVWLKGLAAQFGTAQ